MPGCSLSCRWPSESGGSGGRARAASSSRHAARHSATWAAGSAGVDRKHIAVGFTSLP